jgi:hypothetical protein
MVNDLTNFICDVLNNLEDEYKMVIDVPEDFCEQCVDHYNEERTSRQTGRLIMDKMNTEKFFSDMVEDLGHFEAELANEQWLEHRGGDQFE